MQLRDYNSIYVSIKFDDKWEIKSQIDRKKKLQFRVKIF